MAKKIISTFWFLLFISASFAQISVTSDVVNLQEKMPQSSGAGSLGRYLDFPVNMATGVPNIEIPLYTIQSGNLKVPIVLRYHAGGIKVNDKASWVGLGWSLSPGGSVIKKTNGLDDFYLTSGTSYITPTQDWLHPNYSNIPYNPGYGNMTDAVDGMMNTGTELGIDSMLRFMSKILVGQNDGEADEFLYSLPTGSGKFYYNQKLGKFQTSKTDGTIAWADTSSCALYTKDGISYGFGRPERTKNPAFAGTGQEYFKNAWHLTALSENVNGKTVGFEYENYYDTTYSGVAVTNDYTLSGPFALYHQQLDEIKRIGDNYIVKTIRSSEEIINFIKDTAKRLDEVGPHALKEIQVYNRDSTLTKKFLFTYYYTIATNGATALYGSANQRLMLKSLQEIDYDDAGQSHPKPPYYFDYDTSVKLPFRLSYAQDKWGYYNGKLTNDTPIPDNPYFTLLGGSGANRNVDTNYSKASIIKSVLYPTGGKASFEFESNRWNDTSFVGGLRVKKITYYDSVAKSSLSTEYRYPWTYFHWTPKFWYQLTHLSDFYIFDYYHYFYFQFMPLLRVESEPVNASFFNQGSPGYYNMVEKIDKSTAGDFLSRHYFAGFTEPITGYSNLMSVPHEKVGEVENIEEYQTEIYKRESNGTYTLIQRDTASYTPLDNLDEYVWNAKGAWCWDQTEWCEWPEGDPLIIGPTYLPFNISPSLQAYKVYPSQTVKTEQSSNTITSTGTLNKYSFTDYDSTNGNVRLLKSTDSKGDTTIQLINYAADFIKSGATSGMNHQIDTMYYHNYLAAPIEIITLLKKKDSVNATIQGAILYEYENLKIKKVYRLYDKIPFSFFNVAYNDSTNFYKDSHYTLYQEITEFGSDKNPLTVVTQGQTQSYIWDNNFILAQTMNADNHKTAYSSFESSAKGNWSYTGNVVDTAGVTGKKSYALSSGNISVSSVSNGDYIVSYWSKSGAQSVNSSSYITGRTSNGWTYYEHAVTLNSGTITVSGSGIIDELRLYPKDAQMTTATYKSLVGITSQCDAANKIVYYEYDGPDRLILIRDQDKNIVKKFCYNYAGQPVSCGVYYNGAASHWFIRNNCTSGYIGDSVLYTVPANTYGGVTQAIADSLAQADITANGQAYANVNANCIPECTIYNCTGVNKKCINGYCETGVRINKSATFFKGTWTCTYVYRWSDCSESANQTETSGTACTIGFICGL